MTYFVSYYLYLINDSVSTKLVRLIAFKTYFLHVVSLKRDRLFSFTKVQPSKHKLTTLVGPTLYWQQLS